MMEESPGSKHRGGFRTGMQFGPAFYVALLLALLLHLGLFYVASQIETVRRGIVGGVKARLVKVKPMEEIKPLPEQKIDEPEMEEIQQKAGDPLGAMDVEPVEIAPEAVAGDFGDDLLGSMKEKMAGLGDETTSRLIRGTSSAAEKRQLIQRFAGSSAVRQIESGVDEGLEFLAKKQNPDGSWPSGQLQRNAGITGLAVMCFVTAGFSPGAYGMRQNTQKGLEYLVGLSQEEGVKKGLIRSQDHEIYSHAIATLALCEAYSRTEDEEWLTRLKPVIRSALDYLLRTQNTERKPQVLNGPVTRDNKAYGGWRYKGESTEADLSVTGWCMMALAAGRSIGFDVDKEHIKRGLEYVANCNAGKGFSYQAGGGPSEGPTAIGLLCLEMYGFRGHQMATNAAQFILQHPPDWEWKGRSFYYWYYATQAAFHKDPRTWKTWQPMVTRILLDHQKDDGSWGTSLTNVHERGVNDPHRVYATAMAVLSLQIYYRHFPVYLRHS